MNHSRTLLLAAGALALPSFVLSADPPGAGIVATFTVNAGTSERHDTPVSASLQGIAFDPARPSLKLHERTGEKRVPVASQVDTEFVPRLWWILEGVTPAGTERVFEFSSTQMNHPHPKLSIGVIGGVFQGQREAIRGLLQ